MNVDPGLEEGKTALKVHTHSDALKRLLKWSELIGECRMWKGPMDSFGYGMIMFRRKTVRTHRLMYRIAYGPFDGALCVLHKCDIPRCINPGHLFLGTKQDNMADCVSKGRIASGSKIGASKLTKAQAEQIIAANLQRYDRRSSALAKEMGVTVSTIRAVRNGVVWKYLERKSN